MSNRTLVTIIYAYISIGLGAFVWWVFWSGYGDPVGDSIWFASLLAILYISERWTRKHSGADSEQ